jgi:hypothetical protein
MDPNRGGQKLPTKIEENSEISFFEVLDVFIFGLKASPVAWTYFVEA